MIAKEKFLNNSLSYLYKQIRKIYLNSNIYNRKISRVFDGGLNYVPNLSLLNCIINQKRGILELKILVLRMFGTKLTLTIKILKRFIVFIGYLQST